jgi:hypothetical protein
VPALLQAAGDPLVAVGEVRGSVLVEPGGGVDGFAVGAAGADLEVQMCSGAHARGADIADVLPGVTRSPATDVDAVLPHVRVRGRDGLAVDGVLDDDEAAVAAGELRDGDGAVGGGEDRGAVGCGEVGAGVQSSVRR